MKAVRRAHNQTDGLIGVIECPMASAGELMQAFAASTGAMVCVVDGAGRIRFANPALELFTGLPAAELLGRAFWSVWVPREHHPHVQDAIAVAMIGGRSLAVVGDWIAHNRSRRRVAMQNSVLLDADDRPFAVASVGIDVTEIHQRAVTDPLTGTANRATLFDELRKHLHPERGAGCGLIFCDLDALKTVNNGHGHVVGDRLLVEVAERLREVTGDEDVVARFGGDEFVILHPHPDLQAVTTLAERITARLSKPLTGELAGLTLQISLGVGVGQPGEHPDVVMVRADRSMYHSKHRRRRARRES